MTTLQWGILGTAKIARTVMIPAMRDAPTTNLVAIASENGKATDAAREFSIPRAHASFAALLEDPTAGWPNSPPASARPCTIATHWSAHTAASQWSAPSVRTSIPARA